LTTAIDKLFQWNVTWQLPIAIDKCFLCHISNTHNSYSNTYHVNGCALPLVDSNQNLGFTVDSRSKFDKHIALIVHTAMSRCRLILKCFILEMRLYCSKRMSHTFALFLNTVPQFGHRIANIS